MNDEILARVRRVASDVFNVPAEKIGPDASPDTLEQWDSLQHLNFVLALEHEFSVEFQPEDVEQMLSIELVTMITGETMERAGA